MRRITGGQLRLRRWLYCRTHGFSEAERRNVFIFGCQRSGTTMLGRVFQRDLRTAVLQEESVITQTGAKALRLKPLPEVRRALKDLRRQLVIAKPLVESHRVADILDAVPNARAIWVFRDYRDVVASNVKRFSSQVEGLRMALTGDPPSWRSEGASEKIQAIRRRFYHEDMRREDAAALGWFTINRMLYDHELLGDPRLTLFQYEDFVREPEQAMHRLYAFLDTPYPPWDLTAAVDTKSVALGRDSQVHPDIATLCIGLQSQLLSDYERQKEGRKI